MSFDHDLREAVEAMRASGVDPDADPFSTQDRVLATLARQRRVRRQLAAALMVVTLSFTGTTAWAWATGNLPAPVERLLGIEAAEVPPERESPGRAEVRRRGDDAPPVQRTAEPALDAVRAPDAVGAEAPPPEGAAPDTAALAPAVGPIPAADPGPARTAIASGRRVARATSIAPEPPAPPTPESVPDRRLADYRAAHEAHFRQGDPARALALWDAFLSRWPRAELAPEARYNRALTLIRLGRHAEAADALRPFAEGAHGAYRQEEAARLIEALAP